MPRYEPPYELPARLLNSPEMIEACQERDFTRIFTLVRSRAGIYPSLIARRCDMTPSRVGEVMSGQRAVKDINVVERVADGLRIPGNLLGLARRAWERGEPDIPRVAAEAADVLWTPPTIDDPWTPGPDADCADTAFVVHLIERQLPEHYRSANFFGSRQGIPPVLHHAQTITRLLEHTNGSTRQALLHVGGLIAEFLGWLYQDLGNFRVAAFWSDRAMEWAQEAADDHMQSYVLYRKSHQAAARVSAEKAVSLARAAQRIPGLTPQITALAAVQEARGYALMRNPRASLAKFDEAHALAAKSSQAEAESSVDASYCTPAYVEIQRATCWIDLGDPTRAVRLFEAELATVPREYRNDRGVYFARLARAYAGAREPEQSAGAATTALAIVNQTGSGRTMAELTSVAHAVESRQDVTAVATFLEHLQVTRDRFAA